MHFTVASLALVAVVVHAAEENNEQQNQNRCWSSGNGQSGRWWNEGERIDRGTYSYPDYQGRFLHSGKYWYECRRGELEPRGCFTTSNERIFIGGKFVENGYEMECIVGDGGYLKFKFSACVPSGQGRFEPGQTWEDGQVHRSSLS